MASQSKASLEQRIITVGDAAVELPKRSRCIDAPCKRLACQLPHEACLIPDSSDRVTCVQRFSTGCHDSRRDKYKGIEDWIFEFRRYFRAWQFFKNLRSDGQLKTETRPFLMTRSHRFAPDRTWSA